MKKQSHFWAMMCHLSTFMGFLIPGFSLIAPLIIWAWKREGDPLVYENGRHVINFVLTFWIYAFSILVVLVAFVLLFWFPGLTLLERVLPHFVANLTVPALSILYILLGGAYGCLYFVFHFVLPIYGALKALNGEVYRYPLTLTLLKEKDLYPEGKTLSPK